jgi:FkbM family methyltransferase
MDLNGGGTRSPGPGRAHDPPWLQKVYDAYDFVMPVMLRRLGLGVGVRDRFLAGQRAALLGRLQVSALLDVGANVGQYARQMRRLGYRGPIHSFEPGKEAMDHLRRAARGDSDWYVHEVALGNCSGHSTLRSWAGSRSVWSSLRKPDRVLGSWLGAPAEEDVEVGTLRAWLDSHEIEVENSWLKVDVQGSEREVLTGAGERLGEFAVIEFEAPIRTAYRGEAMLGELLELVQGHGFVCCSIMTERFEAQALGSLDVDVLVVRKDLADVQ